MCVLQCALHVCAVSQVGKRAGRVFIMYKYVSTVTPCNNPGEEGKGLLVWTIGLPFIEQATATPTIGFWNETRYTTSDASKKDSWAPQSRCHIQNPGSLTPTSNQPWTWAGRGGGSVMKGGGGRGLYSPAR